MAGEPKVLFKPAAENSSIFSFCNVNHNLYHRVRKYHNIFQPNTTCPFEAEFNVLVAHLVINLLWLNLFLETNFAHPFAAIFCTSVCSHFLLVTVPNVV